MAVSPLSAGKRYSPLLLLAAVQLLLVVVAPSTPPKSTQVGAGGALEGVSSKEAAALGGTDAAGGPAGAGAAGAGTSAGTSASHVAAGGTAAGAGATGPGGGGSGGPADLSNCDSRGRQVGPTFYMPPCAPVWHGGDNGGATMTGVNATQIKYLFYRAQGNAEVNAILAREDLAATDQQFCEAVRAFDAEVNKRYEKYGRKFVSMDGPGNHAGSAIGSPCSFPYYQGQCSLTPPAPDCERAEADQIAAMKPAMVLAPIPDPAFYNQLGKDHIIVVGGEDEPDSYHQAVAPYYYDVFRNGTRIADMLAEYYCNKLNNKPPKFAGSDVYNAPGFPSVRKLAITYPATNGDPTFTLSANEFIKQVTGGLCNSPGGVTAYAYQSDITTAEQQSNTTIAGMIANHITTVICLCDPIAPVFLTNTMDANGYHPENLMTGSGLLDYDALAQLYNKKVWDHAFGLSELTNTIPFEQTDAVRAYNDGGFTGQPDKTENLNWAYYSFMASAFQMAGPKPTVAAIRTALFGADPLGGDPLHALIAYGHPNDYTGIKDAREVFWCSTQTSALNGNAGSYIPVDGGKRYQLHQMPTGDPQVFTNGFCS